MDSLYEKLSNERKDLQAKGEAPDWFTTGGWQLFKAKYLYGVKTPKEQYRRIARTAAKHIKFKPAWWPHNRNWEDAFFDLLWKGWLSPSTPVLANTGTKRGLPVSCSGGYIDDSIDGFYSSLREAAILSKNGFGTSGYLGDIRPRGSEIAGGGKASGVMPVLEDFVTMSSKVSQGGSRRGAWAGYLPIDHGDFHEVANFIRNTPDDVNIGWVFTDEFQRRLNHGDPDAVDRWQIALEVKMLTGKGYFFKVDEANRHRPKMYVEHKLDVKASNLCTEIMLHSSDEYTFTCVLSSINAIHADAIMESDAVFVATVFLDCIASEFIKLAKKIKGLEKAVEFTEKGRALGLGVCGFHTYLQMNSVPLDSFEAHMFNNRLFKHLHDESLKASQWLAGVLGEPEWCKGHGVRNTHRTAVAPTKSTALIMGGVSEGINPDPAMTFTQLTPAGEVDRANPVLLAIMKERGVYDDKHMQEIVDAHGSVQGVDWLSEHEKNVYKTAFEYNQEALIRLAAARQRWICQGQSLNLFFSSDEEEAYIAYIFQLAMENPDILAVYYTYSRRGVLASKGECEACM